MNESPTYHKRLDLKGFMQTSIASLLFVLLRYIRGPDAEMDADLIIIISSSHI